MFSPRHTLLSQLGVLAPDCPSWLTALGIHGSEVGWEMTEICLAFVLVLLRQLQLITRDPGLLHGDAVNRLGGNKKVLETHSSHPHAHWHAPSTVSESSCVLYLCNGFGVAHSLPHSAWLFMGIPRKKAQFTTWWAAIVLCISRSRGSVPFYYYAYRHRVLFPTTHTLLWVFLCNKQVILLNAKWRKG